MPGPARATFVYDGHCVMCSGMARHILARDSFGRVRLVASQSDEGQALYARAGQDGTVLATNLFVERDGRILTHAESSLRIFEEIGAPRALTGLARLLPIAVLDRFYGLVARNRFRLFGRHDACQLVVPARGTGGAGLFRQVLGEAFDRLPAAVRRMHEPPDARSVARGEAEVVRGRGWACRLLCALLRLPPEGRAVPLAVAFERRGTDEVWRRDFGGRVTESRLSGQPPGGGLGAASGRLVERFGLAAIELELTGGPEGLLMRPRRLRVAGVPLPAALVGRGSAVESAPDGRFRFAVAMRLLDRPIVSYSGHLDPPEAAHGGPA